MPDSDRNRAITAEVIARAWRDTQFRQTFKANPKRVLQQAGMSIPGDMEVLLVENTPTVVNAVLPPKADMANFQTRFDRAVRLLQDMPEGLEVRVHRNSATRSYIVMPAPPAAVATGQLSDAQLEQVAGGKNAVATVDTVAQTNEVVSTSVAAAELVAGAVTTAAVAGVVVPCFVS